MKMCIRDRIRRKLHEFPELGIHIPKTQDFICAELDKMGIPYEKNTYEKDGVLDTCLLYTSFPPDDTVNQLLYGNYLDDPETQEPFVPPIEKGYYLLKDRNSQAAEKPNIMKRGSFNFDLAVYDTDNRTLYYLVLDT